MIDDTGEIWWKENRLPFLCLAIPFSSPQPVYFCFDRWREIIGQPARNLPKHKHKFTNHYEKTIRSLFAPTH